jgi:L-aminopeptidase/D-esterase-like protein
MAKRPSMAIGRLGAVSGDGSGDIFIAFSTAFNGQLQESESSTGLSMHPNNMLTPLFHGVVEATEEAIVNAMVAAETMIGADGLKVPELPEDQLRQIMSER